MWLNIQMEDMSRAMSVGRNTELHALSGHATLLAPPRVHQSGRFPNSVLVGFYEGFPTYTWAIVNYISITPPLSGG